MTEYNKPLPVPDADSTPFWDGCREHKLLLQRCDSCAAYRFPANQVCPHCNSREASWTQSAGQGTVFSWIVVRHPVPAEVYGAEVPYAVALIDLAEGVRIASNVIGCDLNADMAGMAVSVQFDDVTPGISLPKFRPAA